MKPETRAKLSAANREVPGWIKHKTIEKIKKVKDPTAVYLAVVEIVLVIGLAVAFAIYLDTDINVISEQTVPHQQKIALFLVFAAIAVLLFVYNKKFFSQAAKGTKWVWRWKAKKK